MLEKSSYSQQDIDYVYELKKKEKENAASPQMSEDHVFASDIYQSLFLEKIFGGLKERFTVLLQDGEKSNYQLGRQLDNDLAGCVKNKKDEMTKIARGLIKGTKYPMEDTFLSDLWFLIKTYWIDRLFTGNGEEKQYQKLHDAWKNMSYYGELGKALGPIIRQVISELPKEKDDDDDDDD